MTSSGLPRLPCYRQSPVRCLRPETIQVNLVVWGDDLVLQWIHAHASVYGGVNFTRFSHVKVDLGSRGRCRVLFTPGILSIISMGPCIWYSSVTTVSGLHVFVVLLDFALTLEVVFLVVRILVGSIIGMSPLTPALACLGEGVTCIVRPARPGQTHRLEDTGTCGNPNRSEGLLLERRFQRAQRLHTDADLTSH